MKRPEWARDVEARLDAMQALWASTASEVAAVRTASHGLEELRAAVRELEVWRLSVKRAAQPDETTVCAQETSCSVPQPEPTWPESADAATRIERRPDRRDTSSQLGKRSSLRELFGRRWKTRGCKLEPSIWDASLLVGLGEGHAASTAWAIMLLLLNTLVQGFITYIVNSELTMPTYTEENLTQYRLWRIDIGHDFRYGSTGGGRSLVARVCSGDAGLETGTAQATAFQEIEDYMGMGPFLAALSCFVWFLGITKDVDAAVQLIIAALRLRGPTTRLSEEKHIEALSTARSLWFVGVQMLRIVVALSLGFGGMQLLCKTISLEGMLRKSACIRGAGCFSELLAICRYDSGAQIHSGH